MKYDVYFHDDFDGRASAAVMLAFLRSRGDRIAHYVPVNYHLLPAWLDEKYLGKHKLFRGKRYPAIILDFLYHPGAVFWFDHHSTTFKKEIWRKKFRPTKFQRCDSTYLSACHLVAASLRSNFGWKAARHIAELVKWLDVVDGARYASAKQTIALKEPALQIEIFIEHAKHDDKMTKRLINLLSEKSLSVIARIPEIKKSTKIFHREASKSLAFYRKSLKVFGKGTVIDLTATHVMPLRYAPYYLFPKLIYGVRYAMKEGLFHVGVGANPWLPGKNKIHIGELLKRYGGGGHHDAGGLEFSTREEAQKTLGEIIRVLNQ